MFKNFFRFAIITLSTSLLFTACSKDDDAPVPEEQELITTVIIHCENGGTTQSFTYKIENGLNNTTPGTIQIDSIKLAANTVYTTTMEVLNEKADTEEEKEVTNEIKEENTEHLFLYASTPASGAGSVAFSNGNKDDNGNPFNLTGSLTTNAAGTGTLRIYLMHQPTNKAATTADNSGGETDIDVSFPVVLE